MENIDVFLFSVPLNRRTMLIGAHHFKSLLAIQSIDNRRQLWTGKKKKKKKEESYWKLQETIWYVVNRKQAGFIQTMVEFIRNCQVCFGAWSVCRVSCSLYPQFDFSSSDIRAINWKLRVIFRKTITADYYPSKRQKLLTKVLPLYWEWTSRDMEVVCLILEGRRSSLFDFYFFVSSKPHKRVNTWDSSYNGI